MHIGTQSVSQTSHNGRVFWIDWRDDAIGRSTPGNWLGGWSSIQHEFPFNRRVNDPAQVEAAWEYWTDQLRAAARRTEGAEEGHDATD